jgi:hypothetical protein
MQSDFTALCQACGDEIGPMNGRKRRGAKYCSPACYYAAKSGVSPESFWSRVDRTGVCWLWLGAKSPKGYGKVKWNGRDDRAHRVAWELSRSPVPEGMWVLHTCDTPACCNPLHLFLGDNLANNRDKAAKGRHISGERHKLAKLTEADVITIRAALSARSASRRGLAATYGVSRSLIDHIAAGRTWKHAQPS